MTHYSSAPGFLVEPLQADQIRPVFALLNLVDPGLSLDSWLRYARRLLKRGSPTAEGVLIARRNTHAHPSGAAFFRQDRFLSDTNVLTVERIVSVDLFLAHAVTDVLLGALEARAIGLGCEAVRIVVHERHGELAQLLLASGHTPVGATFSKALARI